MTKMIGVFVMALALTGCGKYATKEDLTSINANIDQVKRQANEAYAYANKVNERVDLLTETAATCCAENRARLDALFEKAMRK